MITEKTPHELTPDALFASYRKDSERLAWLNAQDFLIQDVIREGKRYIAIYINGRRWVGPTVEVVIDEAMKRLKGEDGGR